MIHMREHRTIWPMLLRAAVLAAASACSGSQRATGAAAHAYVPRARTVAITTVPMLVREQQRVFPFLTKDFARGGVLDGKEVYAFSPSTVTVVEGDTIHFVFINPEDDVHSFVLPDFAVALPGGKTTEATYVARHAGIFKILCSVPSHLPMMSGQLVVLPAGTMAGADAGAPSPTP